METPAVASLQAHAEPLAAIFEVAQLAGVVWLNFDSEAAVIDGLPIFEMPDPAS